MHFHRLGRKQIKNKIIIKNNNNNKGKAAGRADFALIKHFGQHCWTIRGESICRHPLCPPGTATPAPKCHVCDLQDVEWGGKNIYILKA